MTTQFTRFEDWPQRLSAHFEEWKQRPFEQGVTDCGHFAADAVVAVTGVDVYQAFRGKYSTPLGYAKILKKLKFNSISAFCDSHAECVSVLFARRGDIVLRFEGENEALGVCDGSHSMFLDNNGGLVKVPTDSCVFAWRIG